MPREMPNCTAGARYAVASRGDPHEELADALYARAEILGGFECTCEVLATVSELITRFGDIRSTVVDAYELREQIIEECFRRCES